MRTIARLILSLALLAPSFSEAATQFIDTFEGGQNTGGWTYSDFDDPGAPFLRPDGGNPGWYARTADRPVDVFPPRFHTVGTSWFTGDYSERGVVTISIDLRTFSFEQGSSVYEAPLNLRIDTDAGTPMDATDDFLAFFRGTTSHRTPSVNHDWERITFSIPSQQTSLPEGWRLIGGWYSTPHPPPAASWSLLIHNVTSISFEYGCPLTQLDLSICGPIQLEHVDVGADNPTLTVPAPTATPIFLILTLSLTARSMFRAMRRQA